MNIGMWVFVGLAVVVIMTSAWLRVNTEYLPSDVTIAQEAAAKIASTLGLGVCALGFLIGLLVHLL